MSGATHPPRSRRTCASFETAGTATSLDIGRLIAPSLGLLIDSSVLIAYLDGHEATTALAKVILDDYVRGLRNEGVISAITLGEALVHPYRKGRARELVNELLDYPNLTIRSVDVLVAAEAARMRATTAIGMADAIILATGVLSTTGMLITNDRSLARNATTLVPEMGVCLLAEHT